MTADHYATLGVAPTTEDVVIRAAYLALMRRYHPDTNASPAAAARVRAITAAYEVLNDQDKRAAYDRRRATVAGVGAAEPPPKDLPVGPIVFGVIMLLLVPLLAVAVRSPRTLPQQPDRSTPALSREKPAFVRDPATSCTSQAAHDLIKRELFRMAAEHRGADPVALDALAAQSVLRIDSAAPTQNRRESAVISCRASVVIDLPPGAALAGGQRTLAAELGYAWEAASIGRSANIHVSHGELIARPLAAMALLPRPVDDLAAPPDLPDEAPAPIRPRLAEPPVVSKPPPPPPILRPQARAVPKPAKPAAQAGCKTGGEAPTCGNSNLAALDRHVTLLFDQSWKYGDAAKRAALIRTRDQFLARRDKCRSDSCARNVYLDRMREVTDIMTGQPQQPR